MLLAPEVVKGYLKLMLLAPEVAPTEIDEEPMGPTNCPEKQAHWLLPVQTTIENVHSWEECGEEIIKKSSVQLCRTNIARIANAVQCHS